jgi:hypothetical protein
LEKLDTPAGAVATSIVSAQQAIGQHFAIQPEVRNVLQN